MLRKTFETPVIFSLEMAMILQRVLDFEVVPAWMNAYLAMRKVFVNTRLWKNVH